MNFWWNSVLIFQNIIIVFLLINFRRVKLILIIIWLRNLLTFDWHKLIEICIIYIVEASKSIFNDWRSLLLDWCIIQNHTWMFWNCIFSSFVFLNWFLNLTYLNSFRNFILFRSIFVFGKSLGFNLITKRNRIDISLWVLQASINMHVFSERALFNGFMFDLLLVFLLLVLLYLLI